MIPQPQQPDPRKRLSVGPYFGINLSDHDNSPPALPDDEMLELDRRAERERRPWWRWLFEKASG